MKYIIFQNGEAVIFADFVGHDFVAGNRPVRSAGFCRIETKRNQWDDVRAVVSTFGESTSLNVKSRPEDAELIESLWR